MPRRGGPARVLGLSALLLGLLVIMINSAWLCDDAYITFRVIDNFHDGYGLRWNISERVQVYTHPLWMLVVSALYSYTNEVYYSVVTLSLVLSLLAVAVLSVRLAPSLTAAALGTMILGLSKAFVDYCTSGLENPLSYLIVVLLFTCHVRTEPGTRQVLLVSLLTGLALLNRIDLGLICAPVLLMAVIRGRSIRGVLTALLGLTPLLIWELFSLLYYGFLIPNTAYAKLATGISRHQLVMQGGRYLLSSLQHDPLTLLVTVAAAVLVIARKDRDGLPVMLGAGLYCIYLVSIGGDFMTGRFLGVPVLCAVLAVLGNGRTALRRSFVVTVLVAAALTLGYRVTVAAPLVDSSGIADERRAFSRYLGLTEVIQSRGACLTEHMWARRGLELRRRNQPTVEIAGGVGMLGYYAGPVVHVLDINALGDPLLARMPADQDWRIGHFVRKKPRDYLYSLQADQNLIRHPGLAIYCDKLFLITRGPLGDGARLREILYFNLGRYDHLLDAYLHDMSQLEAAPVRDRAEASQK
jgi:arabinofuranosyltransferase